MRIARYASAARIAPDRIARLAPPPSVAPSAIPCLFNGVTVALPATAACGGPSAAQIATTTQSLGVTLPQVTDNRARKYFLEFGGSGPYDSGRGDAEDFGGAQVSPFTLETGASVSRITRGYGCSVRPFVGMFQVLDDWSSAAAAVSSESTLYRRVAGDSRPSAGAFTCGAFAWAVTRCIASNTVTNAVRASDGQATGVVGKSWTFRSPYPVASWVSNNIFQPITGYALSQYDDGVNGVDPQSATAASGVQSVPLFRAPRAGTLTLTLRITGPKGMNGATGVFMPLRRWTPGPFGGLGTSTVIANVVDPSPYNAAAFDVGQFTSVQAIPFTQAEQLAELHCNLLGRFTVGVEPSNPVHFNNYVKRPALVEVLDAVFV